MQNDRMAASLSQLLSSQDTDLVTERAQCSEGNVTFYFTSLDLTLIPLRIRIVRPPRVVVSSEEAGVKTTSGRACLSWVN